MCLVPVETEEGVQSPELVVQMAVSGHVGAGKQTGVLQEPLVM